MAANRDRAFTQSSRPAPPLDQQRVIAEQTEAFLAKGGAIQQIPNGVSGQVGFGAPRSAAAIAAAAAATAAATATTAPAKA
jgi:hypothetical protein